MIFSKSVPALLIMACSICTSLSYGQIKDIKIDEQTTVEKLYAGLYARLLSSSDSLGFKNRISFRAAARAVHRFNPIFSVMTQAALQTENETDDVAIINYALRAKLSEKIRFRAGSFATPFLRPSPIVWQGHSETYTQSRFIPGKLGAMIDYAANDERSVHLGYFHQNDSWAGHASFDFGRLGMAGWIQIDGEYLGLMSYKNEKMQAIVNYGSIAKEWTGSVFYAISDRYTLYTDANFLQKTESSEVFRLGGRNYFRNDEFHLGGFFALQYDFAEELISVELLIHLN